MQKYSLSCAVPHIKSEPEQHRIPRMHSRCLSDRRFSSHSPWLSHIATLCRQCILQHIWLYLCISHLLITSRLCPHLIQAAFPFTKGHTTNHSISGGLTRRKTTVQSLFPVECGYHPCQVHFDARKITAKENLYSQRRRRRESRSHQWCTTTMISASRKLFKSSPDATFTLPIDNRSTLARLLW